MKKKDIKDKVFIDVLLMIMGDGWFETDEVFYENPKITSQDFLVKRKQNLILPVLSIQPFLDKGSYSGEQPYYYAMIQVPYFFVMEMSQYVRNHKMYRGLTVKNAWQYILLRLFKKDRVRNYIEKRSGVSISEIMDEHEQTIWIGPKEI